MLISVLCVAFLTTRRGTQGAKNANSSEKNLSRLFDRVVPEIQNATALRLAAAERRRQERAEAERQARIQAEALQKAQQEEAERLVEERKREKALREEERLRQQKEREVFIKDKLNLIERGVRVWWQKANSEVALLAGEEHSVVQVAEIKKRLALEWLNRHSLRSTDEQSSSLTQTIQYVSQRQQWQNETVPQRSILASFYWV